MQQYETLKNPNLPDNDVIAVAVGQKYKDTIVSLNKYQINVFEINGKQDLPDYIRYHADINFMHFSQNVLYFDSGIKAGELQNFFNIRTIGEKTSSEYPKDCFLNSVIIGKNLICNEKIASKDILNAAYKCGLNIINVKQGYTKCSICPVTERCIITDDESVYKSTQNYFDDVLMIRKGSVLLEGKDYGFIGGATGKLGKDKLAFNGRIDSHSDCNRILDILYKYNIEPVELLNNRLIDIGSIIPLLQSVK